MQSPRPQPTPPRPKPVAPAVAPPRVVTPVRQHTFAIPDVREIPRRAEAGPWEAGW